MSQKHPTLGVIFALIAAILFGLNASTTKVIIEAGINAEQVVFIRSLFSLVLALSWALISNRKELFVKPKMLPRLFVLGVIGVGMLQWTYSMSLVRLPVGIALLIEYTAVLWVPIVALVLFKEKVSRVIWVGAALVIGGLAVVAQIWDTQLDPYGILLAFGAAISLTIYFITGERIQRVLPTNVVLAYGMFFATLFFLPLSNFGNFDFSIISESLDLTGNLAGIELPMWGALIWLGVLGSFVPMAFSYLALRHLSATVVGIIATSETVLAFGFALAWLGEIITLTQALGGIVVVIGILIAQTARKQSSQKVVE
ncbi:MAG: DMT family transporter [Aquiluna sp.]|nr:DMT family transporter [Aquiluna sp.]